MKAKEAAAQSRRHLATRCDGSGHLWIYYKDKNGLLIRSDSKDGEGDYMWELHENPLDLEQHDDWIPYRGRWLTRHAI